MTVPSRRSLMYRRTKYSEWGRDCCTLRSAGWNWMARFPPNEALENNRRAKYYSITAKGKKTVAAGTQTWDRLSVAVQRVLAR